MRSFGRKAMSDGTGRRTRAWLAAGLIGLGLLTGCNEDEALAAFRGASATAFQTGVKSLLVGVVDGVFAVYDLGVENAGNGSSGGTSSGGSSGSTSDSSSTDSSGGADAGGDTATAGETAGG